MLIVNFPSTLKITVLAVNNRRSRSPLVQQCGRVIWFICAMFDFDLHAEHIPGYTNVAADLLSPWSFDSTASASFFLFYKILLITHSLIAHPSYLSYRMISHTFADIFIVC